MRIVLRVVFLARVGTAPTALVKPRDWQSCQGCKSEQNRRRVVDNISLHHNMVHDVAKHGLNIADGSENNIVIWNNIIYNVTYAGVRFNTLDLNDAKLYNNTIFNTNTADNGNYGILTHDWNLSSTALDARNNIFVPAAGTRYAGGSVGLERRRARSRIIFGSMEADTPDRPCR